MSSTATTGGWGRRRLLATVAGALAAAGLLVLGLGYGIYGAVTSRAAAAPAGLPAATGVTDVDTPARGQADREGVAAAPMLAVSPEDARRGTPAAAPLPTISVPPATRVGPVQVPTGFPHTPEGAIGQLAAIETSVLEAMSIPHAGEVYAEWALPGGVGALGWELTANVQAFLGSHAGGQTMSIGTAVTAIPVAGLVKGTDGPDWVLACVLLDVRAVAATQARSAMGTASGCSGPTGGG